MSNVLQRYSIRVEGVIETGRLQGQVANFEQIGVHGAATLYPEIPICPTSQPLSARTAVIIPSNIIAVKTAIKIKSLWSKAF